MVSMTRANVWASKNNKGKIVTVTFITQMTLIQHFLLGEKCNKEMTVTEILRKISTVYTFMD